VGAPSLSASPPLAHTETPTETHARHWETHLHGLDHVDVGNLGELPAVLGVQVLEGDEDAILEELAVDLLAGLCGDQHGCWPSEWGEGGGGEDA
jgi:hypothetical protein